VIAKFQQSIGRRCRQCAEAPASGKYQKVLRIQPLVTWPAILRTNQLGRDELVKASKANFCRLTIQTGSGLDFSFQV
jgi:hypothetical protein